MMIRLMTIGALAIGFAGFQPASACEFHDGGFGPMGSKFSAYYPGEHAPLYQDELDDPALTNSTDSEGQTQEAPEPRPAVRSRPTFSSASMRAANSAKANLAKADPKTPVAKAAVSKADR